MPLLSDSDAQVRLAVYKPLFVCNESAILARVCIQQLAALTVTTFWARLHTSGRGSPACRPSTNKSLERTYETQSSKT